MISICLGPQHPTSAEVDSDSLAMASRIREELRVLVANERDERIALITRVVNDLGHVVIAASTEVSEVGALTRRELPDVALVGLGVSSEHALDLIGQIVREAACPVIALLEAEDPRYMELAAQRGVFAYLVDGDSEKLQSALEVTLRRFAEFHNLQGAFGRRSIIERAKGILMERHQISEEAAFDLLRDQARSTSRKLSDVALAVVEGHRLLPPFKGAASADTT